MEDNEKKIPDMCIAGAINAARRGMSLEAIAARAGMRLTKLSALIEENDELALLFENAIADWEESKRDKIDATEAKAEAAGENSLVYKINSEALKELAARKNANRAAQVVQQGIEMLSGIDYEEYSEEEAAAIRARTEAQGLDD